MEKIYLDEMGYKDFLEQLNNLEKNRLLIIDEINKVDKINDKYKYSYLIVLKENIEERIFLKRSQANNIEIVSKSNENESCIIDINDIVRIKLFIPNEGEAVEEYELVAGETDILSDIPKLSVNSPLGKALYKRSVGETTYYSLKDEKVNVEILEKIKTNKLIK